MHDRFIFEENGSDWRYLDGFDSDLVSRAENGERDALGEFRKALATGKRKRVHPVHSTLTRVQEKIDVEWLHAWGEFKEVDRCRSVLTPET